MPQQGRPSADSFIGAWQDEGGGTTDIYQSIDEVTPSDADFIESELAPSNSVYVTKLTVLTDPVTSSGHIFRFRTSKDQPGGAQINGVYELREAWVSEPASLGTLISTDSETDVGASFGPQNFTLSPAEADAITDYGNLYARPIANQV